MNFVYIFVTGVNRCGLGPNNLSLGSNHEAPAQEGIPCAGCYLVKRVAFPLQPGNVSIPVDMPTSVHITAEDQKGAVTADYSFKNCKAACKSSCLDWTAPLQASLPTCTGIPVAKAAPRLSPTTTSCSAAEQAAIQNISAYDFSDASNKCGHTLSEEEERHAQSVTARSGRRSTATGSGTKGLVVTAPQCYAGLGGALVLKEDVVVKIDDLRANGAGRMEVTGIGIAASICSSKDFTKNCFKIITGLSDCQPDEIKIPEVDFYSDQDQDAVKVTV